MKETIYTYNSGDISTDGRNLIFKKDHNSPLSIGWTAIQGVEVRSSHVSIGGQQNYTHLLIVQGNEGIALEEWRMPNSHTAEEAGAAVIKYQESHSH